MWEHSIGEFTVPIRNRKFLYEAITLFKNHFSGFVGTHWEENVNDCHDSPCKNGGTCHDSINDFVCACKPGFTGKDCSIEINECRSSPCMNNGFCIDLQVKLHSSISATSIQIGTAVVCKTCYSYTSPTEKPLGCLSQNTPYVQFFTTS